MHRKRIAATITGTLTCIVTTLACTFFTDLHVQAAVNQEAAITFNKMYGSSVRGVKSTRTTSDDAKLARNLLEAAQKANGTDPLTVMLYEKTYELGKTHTTSFKAAADALQALSHIAPSRQLEMQEKLLFLYELVFRNANRPSAKEIKAKAGKATVDLMVEVAQAKARRAQFTEATLLYRKAIGIARIVQYDRITELNAKSREMTPLAALDRRIQKAKRAFIKDANDKSAAGILANAYMVDLDRPISARPYAARIWDKKKIELMTLAGKPASDIPGAKANELAKWYYELSGTALGKGKQYMLIRAKMYHNVAKQKGALDKGATDNHTRITLALSKLGIGSGKADQLVDHRAGRLGITTVARAKPRPKPVLTPRPKPKPNPIPAPKPNPVKPNPNPDPEPKDDQAKYANYLDDEVESEYADKKLGDEYWRNRKSIFDFGS